MVDYSETEFLRANAVTETTHVDEQGQTWFEQLLADYDVEQARRGQILDGQILRVDKDYLLVDVGLKKDAMVERQDLSQLDEQFVANLSVGDRIPVYVLQPGVDDQDLLGSLAKGLEQKNWEEAGELQAQGAVLNLEIIGYNKGGLLAQFKTLRAFIPNSLVPQLRHVRDSQRAEKIKKSLVGSQMPVKVTEINRERDQLVVSALAAEEEQRQEQLSRLEKGQVVRGRVVKILDFGAFVDLGWVDGLIHVSELDWNKVKHPSDVVHVGEELDVQVLDVDEENQRVSLSRKALLPNPWEKFETEHQPGSYMEGRVTGVSDFGAFVELQEGIVGLVHVNQLGYSKTQDPAQAVKPGDSILVRILSVDPEKERVALSMRQVPVEKQMAWAVENAQAESQAAGDE